VNMRSRDFRFPRWRLGKLGLETETESWHNSVLLGTETRKFVFHPLPYGVCRPCHNVVLSEILTLSKQLEIGWESSQRGGKSKI